MSEQMERNAYQQLLEGITFYIDKVVSDNKEKTTTARIVSIQEDGSYTIDLEGKQYSNINTIGGTCTMNEMVKVMIPQGQYNNMFILKGGSGSGGGSTSGVTSVNGKAGNVILTASDIGALPNTTVIPTKTSELNNDSSFVADTNYVHTDNNFTTILKDKLNGIADGAEVNVQANWNETNANSDAYIKNKPSIPTKTSELQNDSNYVVDKNYVHTDNNYTNADKTSVGTIKDKVDKVEGKGLSTNDLTDALKKQYDGAVANKHTHTNKQILDEITAPYTEEEKTKLEGIEDGAQKNTVTGIKGNSETAYRTGNVNITKENIGLNNVDNVKQWSNDNHPTTLSGYGITDGVGFTDFDALKGRVDTNEDNIVMLDSDIESLNTDVETLETDVTTVKNAVTTIQDDYVPKSRKINGKALSADIILEASDVKAISTSQKGVANGVAELDANGFIPSSQLPSYVDDVLEYDTKTDFPTTGESGKIYIATDTNLQYRWTGTQYIEISSSLALGETNSTAYRGDRGKIAYDHSQKTSGNPHKVTKSDVGLGNVENYKSVSVNANQGLTDIEKQNARDNIGAGTGSSDFSGKYEDLTGKPTLGTASSKDVPATGNANNSQVVMGNDTRLIDSRKASDVYPWAKEENKPTYTKDEIGLGNVSNVSTNDQTPTFTQNETLANIISGEKLSVLFGKISKAVSSLISHIADKNNPHSVTKSQLGLGNVENTADKDKNVKTAGQLTNAKTINVGNAATGTATSFDGSKNIIIPVNSFKESYLSWGGKNFVGCFGVMDAGIVPELGANRLAYGNSSGITVEYSTDGGVTWLDYGLNNEDKTALFSPCGTNILIGKASSSTLTNKCMVRVSVDSDAFDLYADLKKFIIYISTNGCEGCYCTIDGSLESEPTVFKTFADKVNIAGWSGYNIINIDGFVTYGNSNFKQNQYGIFRFTFGCTETTSASSPLTIYKIYGIGGVGCWEAPSNLAKYGTAYSMDSSQNVTFPARVNATIFNGNLAWTNVTDKPTFLTGGSQTATSVADGGTNVFTFTRSDGTESTFSVKNGSKGSNGKDGTNGTNGKDGIRGNTWKVGTDLTHAGDTAITTKFTSADTIIGDMYLNTQWQFVYQCIAVTSTNSTWEYLCSIKGGALAWNNRNINVASAEQITKSEVDGGENVYRFTLFDGSTSDLIIRNGTGVTIKTTSVTYQTSISGTVIPTGTWSINVPSVTKGQYLWSRTIVSYSDDNSTTTYNVAYQGKDGTNGATGTSAGFGTPTATIDSNVGTPSVAITATGSDTAKVFNFDFKNLKGQKGDTGTPGKNGTDGITPTIKVSNGSDVGNVGTPSVTASTSGTTTTFTFHNLKGEKGENATTAVATESANGLMSKEDKTKLEGIEDGANKYVLPTASSSILGGIKIGNSLQISNGVLNLVWNG